MHFLLCASRLLCTKHDPLELIRIGDLGPLNVRPDTVLLRAAWMNAVPNKESGEAAELSSRAFGQADMTFRECPLLRSLLGVKRTSHFALQISANGKADIDAAKPPVGVLPFSLLARHDTMPYLDSEGRR